MEIILALFIGAAVGVALGWVVKPAVSADISPGNLPSYSSLVTSRESVVRLLRKHIEEFKRYKSEFSMILLEIDQERVSVLTDKLLDEAAARMRKQIRLVDELGRWDNQYFLVLPHTDKVGARVVEDRLRRQLIEALSAGHKGFSKGAVGSIIVAYPDDKDGVEGLVASLTR